VADVSAEAEKLRRLLARHARALKRNLPAALEGDANAVHDARVASRRIREAVPLLAAAGVASRKLARKARRATRALGPVRELDVALALLEEYDEGAPASVAVVRALKESLERRRVTTRADLLERLARFDAGRFVRRVRKVGGGLDEAALPGVRAALASRLARRAGDVTKTIEAAGTLYSPDRLHAVRISVKKLRYALELARLFAGRDDVAPALAPLKTVQQVLGRLHDLDVVTTELARDHAHGQPVEPDPPLAALLGAIEHDARELHARYLKLRFEIVDLATESRRFALSLGPTRRAANARPHTENHGRRDQPVPGAARRGGGSRRRVS
jgi:CHAD domain-containing protein